MMAAKLREHAVPHDLFELPNDEHRFAGADPARIARAYDAAIAFTKRHLGLR